MVFVSYSGKLYKPLRDIARQTTRWARTMARLERIGEILRCDEVLEERGGRAPKSHRRASGDIRLESVSFRYAPDRWAVRDVDLHVPAGHTVAVVGASGAGKSTVGALVARFYDPTSGVVRFDGRDTRECSLEWLREQVGVLQQDTILFSGTIRDNIAYGREAPAWRIAECAELAGATDFIEQLPLGLDTVLGPGGTGLSGGQRQRIGVARVLLRDPPVLVLDEPTTGLDAESERRVLDGVFSLMNGRTTLFVTHSMPLARSADVVVVMSDGRITEVGPPEELLSRSSAFGSLWSTQVEQDAGGEWSVSLPLPVGVQGVVEQVEEQGGPGRAGPVPAPDGAGRQVETDPERRPRSRKRSPGPVAVEEGVGELGAAGAVGDQLGEPREETAHVEGRLALAEAVEVQEARARAVEQDLGRSERAVDRGGRR